MFRDADKADETYVLKAKALDGSKQILPLN